MAELKRISVSEILPNDDRKEGGSGDIKKLAQSIKTLGLINPITVREIEDEKYRYVVVAGRRRLAAVTSLFFKKIEAVVYGANEEIPDNEIALAENINRLDLHPLDEGDKYKGLVKQGKNIEDICKTFDRSQAHIYQRMKLCDLSEDLKGVFRAGGLTITQAAKIASVPEEVQKKIFGQIRDCNAKRIASFWAINEIIDLSIKRRLFFKCEKCEKCTKRTWYSNDNLFPELFREEDYCFDDKCYTREVKSIAIEEIKEFFKKFYKEKKIFIYSQDDNRNNILNEIKKIEGCEIEVYDYGRAYSILDEDEVDGLPEEAKEKVMKVIYLLPFTGEFDYALKEEEYEKYFLTSKKATEEEKILIEKLPEECREAAYEDLKRCYFLSYKDYKDLRKKTYFEILKRKLSEEAYFHTEACRRRMLQKFFDGTLFAFEVIMNKKTSFETFLEDTEGLPTFKLISIYAYASFLDLCFQETYSQENFIKHAALMFGLTEDEVKEWHEKNTMDFLNEKYKVKTETAPEEATEEDEDVYVEEEVIDIEPFRKGENTE